MTKPGTTPPPPCHTSPALSHRSACPQQAGPKPPLGEEPKGQLGCSHYIIGPVWNVGGSHPVFYCAVSTAASGDLAIAIYLVDKSVHSGWLWASLFCQTASGPGMSCDDISEIHVAIGSLDCRAPGLYKCLCNQPCHRPTAVPHHFFLQSRAEHSYQGNLVRGAQRFNAPVLRSSEKIVQPV